MKRQNDILKNCVPHPSIIIYYVTMQSKFPKASSFKRNGGFKSLYTKKKKI